MNIVIVKNALNVKKGFSKTLLLRSVIYARRVAYFVQQLIVAGIAISVFSLMIKILAKNVNRIARSVKMTHVLHVEKDLTLMKIINVSIVEKDVSHVKIANVKNAYLGSFMFQKLRLAVNALLDAVLVSIKTVVKCVMKDFTITKTLSCVWSAMPIADFAETTKLVTSVTKELMSMPTKDARFVHMDVVNAKMTKLALNVIWDTLKTLTAFALNANLNANSVNLKMFVTNVLKGFS